jgi:hypothetical protein
MGPPELAELLGKCFAIAAIKNNVSVMLANYRR